MPTFEIETGGRTFEVEAPDQAAALSAIGGMQAAAPSTTEDVLKSGGIGLAKGGIGLMGFIGDSSKFLAEGSQAAGNYISGKMGFEPSYMPEKSFFDAITSPAIQSKVEESTGKFYEPKTTAGKYARTVGEFIPASMVGPGGMVAKVGTGVTAAVGSEAAGQATEGTRAEPYARIVGALAGGLTPAIAGRAITPLPTTAARQRLVDVLEGEGVTSLTAGQRTGNKPLQYAESILGDGPLAGAGATRIMDRGQSQFTEATMRRAGAGPDATPEVLAANQTRLGDQFRDLAARNNLTPDNQFITDLTQAVGHYRRVPDSQQRQMLQGYVDDIVQHVNAGSMPGPQYQEMRSRLSRQAQGLRNSDPTLSEALRDMRNALDSAMERSIPAGSADAELWRQSRLEYAAQKTIEQAASRAGATTAEGQIVPANLRNAAAANNRGAYARGEGDFSELARAGSGIMAPLPNSGTGQRNLLTDAAKLPFTMTAGRVITSPPVQAYLGNQLLARQLEALPSGTQAVVRALLAQDRTPFVSGPSNKSK